ncbi:MAG: glycosyltransferase family 4 protein [Rhodoblastus sp.]|nr:glycosyltransferase family 4 protein [Rhodoblastus sp.]
MGDDRSGSDGQASDRRRILEFQIDQLRRELERLEKRHAEAIYSVAWHFGAPVRVVERAIRKMLAKPAPADAPASVATMSSAPATRPAPARRLFVDVTAIVAHDDRTGIQRVVRQVVRALYAEQDLDVAPVAVRLQNGKLWTCETYVAAETGRAQSAVDRPLEIETGDRLLMLDNSWKDFAAFANVFAEVRAKQGAIVSCVYDLIPQLYKGASVGDVPEVHLAWLKAALLESDGLIAISRTVAEELCAFVEAQGLPHRAGLRVGWFHCGSDIAPAGAGEASAAIRAAFSSANAFLLVGTLEPRKGHAVALAAFDELWRKGVDARLVFIGRRGWHVDTVIDEMTSHTEFGRRLFWFDAADDIDLAFAYDHCAAALAPSYAEGFGLPIAEAAWRGKPALCSDIPVFREIGGDGALYFRVNDAPALAQLVQDFLAGRAVADPTRVVRPTWRDAGRRIVDIVVRDDWMRTLP